MKKIIISLIIFFLCAASIKAQTATDIIRQVDEKARGESSFAEISMEIIRPGWTREIKMKSWASGTENALILVTEPARDKGIVFLKRDRELWNWQPSIDRVIKLPPSMMMQSWMGSDFTNDDLVKESSIIEDYTHSFLEEDEVNGKPCYKIQLIPKEDAPVVWGKIVTWADKKDLVQLKAEFYDEDDDLISTMIGSDVKMIGGRILPTKMTMIPAEDSEKTTVITYSKLAFDITFKQDYFSLQNMKRLR
ncbi:MAG: outer membrane lipoprotein-sorting protein [Bacteroidia bacterium]|nr:outer membrane lipoprotein-sorting protein [Bacteroidia bacterium]NNM15745.1 outer membrane lipoprotein-sorting protein [Bacteroidia bacterium]